MSVNPVVCPKTGIPMDVLGKPGLTKKFLDQLDNQDASEKLKGCFETQSIMSTLSTISIRPKDEKPEQRKERKQLVKEYRRVRITVVLNISLHNRSVNYNYLLSCIYL